MKEPVFSCQCWWPLLKKCSLLQNVSCFVFDTLKLLVLTPQVHCCLWVLFSTVVNMSQWHSKHVLSGSYSRCTFSDLWIHSRAMSPCQRRYEPFETSRRWTALLRPYMLYLLRLTCTYYSLIYVLISAALFSLGSILPEIMQTVVITLTFQYTYSNILMRGRLNIDVDGKNQKRLWDISEGQTHTDIWWKTKNIVFPGLLPPLHYGPVTSPGPSRHSEATSIQPKAALVNETELHIDTGVRRSMSASKTQIGQGHTRKREFSGFRLPTRPHA